MPLINCEICGKKAFVRSWVTTCSKKCSDRKRYLKDKKKYMKTVRKWQKKNPDKVKKYNKKGIKKFRQENPNYFNEFMKKDYKKHKIRWRERHFVHHHRKEIIEILGKKCCKCGKKGQHIHHTRYKYLVWYHKDLVKYCKFLRHLCKKCHKKADKTQVL